MPPPSHPLTLTDMNADCILDWVLMATGGFVRDFDPATRVEWHGKRWVHMAETAVNGIAERLGVVHANFEFPETGIPDTGIPDTVIPNTGIPDTGIPGTVIPDTVIPGTSPPLKHPEDHPELKPEMTDAYWAWAVATRKDHEFDKGAKRKLHTLLEASLDAPRTGNTSRSTEVHASKRTYVPGPNASGPPNPDQGRVADQVIERVCFLLFESRYERLKALQTPSRGSQWW
jgi:hypothetical protein